MNKQPNFFQFANLNNQPDTKSSDVNYKLSPPIRLWVISVVSILLMVIVVVVFYEHLIEKNVISLTSLIEVAFVSSTLAIIIPPILYFFSYRPLLSQMSRLQETEGGLKLLATALHSAENGVVITDNEGNIQWSNPAFAYTTGLTHTELIGRNLRSFERKPLEPIDEGDRWETILSGKVWMEGVSNYEADGELHLKEQIITPVRNAKGVISHLIFIEKDVTERYELEKTTETLATAALALNQSLRVEDVLDVLLDFLMAFVVYTNGAIILLHHNSRWAVRAHRGPAFSKRFGSRAFFVEIDVLESSQIQQLLETQQTVVLEDTAVCPAPYPLSDEQNGRNWLGVPFVINGKVIGFCVLDKDEPQFFTSQHIRVIEALVSQAASAVENARLFEQVQAGQEHLKFLSHRLVEVQETERRYIARELHDEAGQALASLRLELHLLSHLADEPEAVKAKVPEIQQQVDDISENLHRLAVHLRPASLDHMGLTTALAQHVKTIGSQYNLLTGFEVCGVIQRLSPEVETAVYRVVQEALTNVVRHAHATRVDVLLKHHGDHFVIIVEDDGQGFEPLDVMAGIATSDHLGLVGIRERTAMLGGNLALDSSLGNGTTLKIEVPYDHSRIIS